MHYLKRKSQGKDGYMALKLDMSKAYDRIEWDFSEAIMQKMGFASRWIELISICISSVSYKVVHGSHSIGPINSARGLRQGDPLSPYFFILFAWKAFQR